MTASLLILVKDAYCIFAWRLPLLFVLTLINAVFEGLTLAMLLPLLAVLGFGNSASGPNFVTSMVTALFGTFGLPLTTTSVALSMLALLGVSGVFFLSQAYLAALLQAAYVAHWQTQVFSALSEAAWRFLRRQRSGDIIGAMTSEAVRLGNAFYQANLIVSSLVFLIAQAAIAATIAPAIVVAMFVLAVILFTVTRQPMRRALAVGGDLTQANADLYATAGELIGAMKLIKGTAQESEAKRLVGRVVDRIETLSFRNLFDIQIVRATFEYGSGLTVVGLLIAGPLLLHVEIGAVIIVVAMFVRLFPKVTALRQCLQSFGITVSAYETMRAMKTEAKAAREVSGHTPHVVKSGPVAISFEQTTIRSEEDAAILRSIDLDIAPGSYAAIVGPTGAGKTTLVDCVLGLVMPASGDVSIDGVSIRSVDLPAWRGSVGYLGQDPVLFEGSIRDNIRWGRDGFSDADIAEALETADADFALNAPLGLDAIVRERGGSLSGGERQRLALARALLGTPRLLILDEVTSALDVETERRIADAVGKRRGRTTVLAVTHRLAAISDADLIVMMEAGRVVERGSFAQLLAAQGRFAAFWRTQSEDNSGTTADRLVTA